jgi:hypothetical protein
MEYYSFHKYVTIEINCQKIKYFEIGESFWPVNYCNFISQPLLARAINSQPI